jgi:hypothetical protein
MRRDMMSQSSDDKKSKTPTVKDYADYIERTTGTRPTQMIYDLPEELIDEFWSHINDESEEQVWKLLMKYQHNADCVTILSQILSSVSYKRYLRESEAYGWKAPEWKVGEGGVTEVNRFDLERRKRTE